MPIDGNFDYFCLNSTPRNWHRPMRCSAPVYVLPRKVSMIGIKYNARESLLYRFWCGRRHGVHTTSAFKKRFWKDICLSFISMHYVYIVLWAIVASIIIYPGGEVSYIDALFFGTAAATQSGLNTVDLNRMKTYQQIVIWTVAMVTNPIFVHTAVVFVRIYWFEKRFQYLVQSARTIRRSGTTVASGSDEEQQQDSKARRTGHS